MSVDKLLGKHWLRMWPGDSYLRITFDRQNFRGFGPTHGVSSVDSVCE